MNYIEAIEKIKEGYNIAIVGQNCYYFCLGNSIRKHVKTDASVYEQDLIVTDINLTDTLSDKWYFFKNKKKLSKDESEIIRTLLKMFGDKIFRVYISKSNCGLRMLEITYNDTPWRTRFREFENKDLFSSWEFGEMHTIDELELYEEENS